MIIATKIPKVLMRRFVALFILVPTLFLPALANARPEVVRLRYRVDASQAAKRLLKIRVQIEGLPDGRTVIGLPDFRNSSSTKRISQIGWLSEDGELSALTLEDGQVVVESSGEPVTLAFLLHSETFQHLDRATYVDEYRCLFHLQDVLLQVENQDPKVLLSFVLPARWEVVSTVRPGADATYSIETARAAPFYLGKAESLHDTSSGPVWMAIEPGWLSPPELLALLGQQLQHRQKFSRNVSSKPVLAVFLSGLRLPPNRELEAFGAPQVLVLAAISGADAPLPIPMIQQAMARGLVRAYFPGIANFSAARGPEELMDYLTLKACRKTGVIGRAEFLDAMAQQLWNALGEPRELPSKPRSNPKTGRATTLPARGRSCAVLLDLALSFYGDTSRSLDAFLSGFPTASDELVQEEDLRKRLRREQQAAAALTGAWQNEDPQKLSELLRPFGMLFDRRELPTFGFQLNETFQIAQLGRQIPETAMLETGDRVLAINNYRLMLPDDLLKCRSRLTPGQEVQLEVERRNLPLRLTGRVTREVLMKLEINKLADADKQQKLEQFLSAEADEK